MIVKKYIFKHDISEDLLEVFYSLPEILQLRIRLFDTCNDPNVIDYDIEREIEGCSMAFQIYAMFRHRPIITEFDLVCASDVLGDYKPVGGVPSMFAFAMAMAITNDLHTHVKMETGSLLRSEQLMLPVISDYNNVKAQPRKELIRNCIGC